MDGIGTKNLNRDVQWSILRLRPDFRYEYRSRNNLIFVRSGHIPIHTITYLRISKSSFGVEKEGEFLPTVVSNVAYKTPDQGTIVGVPDGDMARISRRGTKICSSGCERLRLTEQWVPQGRALQLLWS
jgi:hypothetical protein